MNHGPIITLFLTLSLTIQGCGKTPPIPPEPIVCGTLAACATQSDLTIGTSVIDSALSNDETYSLLARSEFSSITPENAMKFDVIHPAPELFNFEAADRIIDFAQSNGLSVRGHPLVWHKQFPEWFENRDWDKYELTLLLITHVQKIVTRYRGRVAAWDVVNEALMNDGSYRDTIWHRVIGPEYIEMAFRAAHTADPDALLFYNDFDAEGLTKKSSAIFDLLSAMKAKGIPIHGIGFQAHFRPTHQPESSKIAANLQRFADLGLMIHITELDVALDSVKPEDLVAQAETYASVLALCLQQANCTSLSVWGVADHVSWVPQHFEGLRAPLLFDSSYQPKLAYDSVLSALRRGRNAQQTSSIAVVSE